MFLNILATPNSCFNIPLTLFGDGIFVMFRIFRSYLTYIVVFSRVVDIQLLANIAIPCGNGVYIVFL